MEPEGLRRSLEKVLKEDKLNVKIVATDQHLTVSSDMKAYKLSHHITHALDNWHVAKNLIKKIVAKAKKKGFEVLLPWAQSICNHLWWASATCEGDVTSLRERWLSVLNHLTNVHRWSGNLKYHKCAHPRYTREHEASTAWLDRDSEPYSVLHKILSNKKFLNAVEKLKDFCHTGDLESFHSQLLKYAPKRQHFTFKGMKARTMLAALDWNTSVRLKSKLTAVFSKRSKSWLLRRKNRMSSYRQVARLMDKTVEMSRGRVKPPKMQAPVLPPNISSVPKPSMRELHKQKRSRFL